MSQQTSHFNKRRNQVAQESRILKFYVGGLKNDKKFDCLRKSNFLRYLSKYIAGANANLKHFLTEIDQVAGRTYRKGSKEYKAVEDLKKDWCREINVIRKCVGCYDIWMTKEKNIDYFILPCTKPHLLIFVKEAKNEGPRMWPAKVLTVNNHKKTATIECFGDHLHDDYTFRQCFLYSGAQVKACKKLIPTYTRNKEIEHQEEYKRSFWEVEQYIKNIRKRFGSFVPAAKSVPMTDFNQHLSDMFPRAFAQITAASDVIEEISDEEINDTVQTESTVAGKRSATKRMISPDSQGYQSRATSTFGSDSDDDIDDFVNQNSSAKSRTPIEFPDNESQTDDGDSISGEQELEANSTEPESSHGRKRKRQQHNKVVLEKQPRYVTRKANRGFETDHSSLTISPIILTDDEDGDQGDTESVNGSPQNTNDQAMNDENFEGMLDNFCEVTEAISKCRRKLKQLNTQKTTIREEIVEHKSYRNGGNLNAMLDALSEITEKISKCEEQLKQLNAQKDIIRVKLTA